MLYCLTCLVSCLHLMIIVPLTLSLGDHIHGSCFTKDSDVLILESRFPHSMILVEIDVPMYEMVVS